MESDVVWEWVQKFLQPSAALFAAFLLALAASRVRVKDRTVAIILWIAAGLVWIWSMLFFGWLLYALYYNVN